MWCLRLHNSVAILNDICFASRRICVRRYTNISGKMGKLYVRSLEEDDRMQMNFNFMLPGKKEKSFNLNRLKNEDLGKSLERISLGVSKYIANKNKKQKKKEGVNETESPDVCVTLISDGNKVDLATPNIVAWKEGSLLKIIDNEYTVLFNPPTVIALNLPQCIMAGFPIFPKYDLEFANVEQSLFIWYKAKTNSSQDSSSLSCHDNESPKSIKQTNSSQEEAVYEEAGQGLYFTPTVNDVGCQLKLKCVPVFDGKEGDTVETVAPHVVDAGPGICPFEDRHTYTMKNTEPGCIRVVSYNVLADYYADSDFSRAVLFPQCPPYALTIDYRKQLFLKEILGYNADLICLQEMDKKIFFSDLSPALHMKGYHSLLKQKAGQVPEGCAMFFRDSKFRLLAQHDIDFSDALENDATYADLLQRVCKSEALKTKILAKGTTLQVAVLEYLEIPGKKLVAMNTHFYFHPKSAHIRLVHADMAMRHMKSICELYKDEEGLTPAVVFCGDFNSSPSTGVYEFFTNNMVTASHDDWLAEGGEEYFGGIDIEHNFKSLSSACGTPPFTNFTGGFRGCLDYIFIDSEQFETEQVIPLPSEEVVSQHIALPNIVFPSDHLALVCDVKWKNYHR